MTFLAIGHARDCILAISDRKESVDQSDPNEVTKYYLSDTGEIYMALSGDGKTARDVLSELRRRQPSGADVFREIDRIAADLSARNQMGQVAGHMIVAGGGAFRVYTISIAFGIMAYAQNDDPILMEGDSGAVAICRNLARDVLLSGMPCETAIRCMHAMASRIAETVESVGERGRYGLDVVVFTPAGAAVQLRRRTDGMGSIRVRFEASGTGPLLGPDGGGA